MLHDAQLETFTTDAEYTILIVCDRLICDCEHPLVGNNGGFIELR
jgi:hypothetical protein